MNRKYLIGFLCGFAISLCVAWTYTWDCATPQGSDAPSVLDDRIRELKYAIAERFNTDHIASLTGTQVSDTDAGYHRDIHFYSTTATDPVLDFTTVGGIDELRYTDSAGSAVQFTSAGAFNVALLTSKTITTPTLTSPVLNTGVSGTAVLDEDDMASNSATKVATQQSIKAYVDNGGGFAPASYAGEQSITFPNGLIIKHGVFAVPSSAALQTVTFEVAFPTACIDVNLTIMRTAYTSSYTPMLIGAPTATSFVFSVASATSMSIHWIAMGY